MEEIGDPILGAGYSEGENEDPGSDLIVSLTSSTTTSDIQSYNVTFSSKISTVTNSLRQVHITIDDPTYVPDVPVGTHIDEETGEEVQNDYPVFTGQVYEITSNGNETVYIPRTLRRNGYYDLNIIGILPDAVNLNNGPITKVYIPKEVVTIAEGGLAGLGEACELFLEAESEPESFEEGWTDVPAANIHWGQIIQYPGTVRPFVISGNEFGTGKNFILGFDAGDEAYIAPERLIVTYDVIENGVTATYHRELPITRTLIGAYRNGVGDAIGTYNYSRTIDIPLEEGQSIDDESIYISNIFAAERDEYGHNIPDTSVNYYVHARVNYTNKFDLSQFVQFDYETSSTFAGYTNLVIDTKVNNDIYPIVNPSAWANSGAAVEAGGGYIRFRLTGLRDYVYHITYESDDGDLITSQISIESPVQYFVVKNGGKIAFLIKNSNVGEDFDAAKIRNVAIESLSITVDLMNNETHQSFGHSASSMRFGYVDMGAPANKANDLNWTLILIVIIYTVIMIAASIGLYIYKVQRFKNDEFRRVKPKSFWYNAGLAYVLLGTILIFITSIIFRWGAFNNSIIVYNPVDPFVIVFGVLAILAIGYYIRWLVVTIKNEKARRKAIKLKLDQDVNDDDGTK